MTRTREDVLDEFGRYDNPPGTDYESDYEVLLRIGAICEKLAERILALEHERDAAVSLATSECAAYDAVTAKLVVAENALARLSEPDEEVLETAGQAYVDTRQTAQGLSYLPVNTNGLIAMRAALRAAVAQASAPTPTEAA